MIGVVICPRRRDGEQRIGGHEWKREKKKKDERWFKEIITIYFLS